jgi:hypothetical protein
MAIRSVATTSTLEGFRTTFNSLGTDVGDLASLGTFGLASSISGLTSISATTITDGTASLNSGSLSGVVNITSSGTIEGGTFTENSVRVATQPFAIAQAVALG